MNKMVESPKIIDERIMKEKEMQEEEPLLNIAKPNPKGGLRTIPFIIVNEAFEKVANYGLSPNMIFYLMKDYHLELATGNYIILYWSSATNALPTFGAFLADSFFGRYPMIALGSIFSFLGMVVLWSTAMIPQARPPPCSNISTITSTTSCTSPSTFQLILLCSSFGLLSIGAGGIRSSSMAFGADQLVEVQTHGNRVLERYFSWYSALTCLSVVIALTLVVYIQDKFGWEVGFGVPVVLMFLSALSFFLASPFYIKLEAKTSLLTGLAKVVVASYKNRHLELPSSTTHASSMYYSKRDSILTIPSDKLRFLNKACMIRDSQQDIMNSWSSLCTVDQVEELKALLKVMPIWLAGALMSVTLTLPSFQVLQASSMDRHVTSWFEIPAGSYGLFTVLTITLWVSLYDGIILPLASKILGKPVILTAKQRMGMGIFMSILSIAVNGLVEYVRRGIAIEEGLWDDPDALVPMSAMWLILPNVLSGISDGLNTVAQGEFYYREFPRSMSSIAVCLQLLGMSVASLITSFIIYVVDNVTKSGGKISWVASNINEGHYDYYCWLMAGLSVCNMMYFLLCSWAYGPGQEVVRVSDESILLIGDDQLTLQ